MNNIQELQEDAARQLLRNNFFQFARIGCRVRYCTPIGGCYVATYVHRTNNRENSSIHLRRRNGQWTDVDPSDVMILPV